MRVLLLALLAAFAFFPLHAGDTGDAGEATITDDRGAELKLEIPVQRIVSLAPHLTEMLFSIGAGDAVVGTSEYSDWPPAALDVPRIGDAFRFDLERIVALQPDIVIAWKSGTPKGVIENIERLGLPVAVIASPHLDAIAGNLRWLGKISGQEDTADEVAGDFVDSLADIRQRYANRQKLDVFYQISAQPLFTVNGEHSISSVIGMCGGRNIFSDLDGIAPTVSREAVVARDPDVIIGGEEAVHSGGPDDWKNWPGMNAVRHDNVFAINAVLLARPTTRIVEGTRELCTALEMARKNLGAADDHTSAK